MKTVLALILAAAILPLHVFAQGSVFEKLKPGQAVFISQAPAAPLVSPSVRLDAVCDETDTPGIALQITDGLARIGVLVDPQSPIVLRYEVAPCETDIQRTRSLAQQDAYQATSRAYELDPPARQFKVPFGKRSRSDARLTLSMLVFKPGQPPMWNVVVAGRSPGLETLDYLAQMAAFSFDHWGEGGELVFDLAEPGKGSNPP